MLFHLSLLFGNCWLLAVAGVSSEENPSRCAAYFLTMSSRLQNFQISRSSRTRFLSIFTVTLEPCLAMSRNNDCPLASSAWNSFSVGPISCRSLCKQPLQVPSLWQFRRCLWGRLQMYHPLNLFFSGPRHPSYITLVVFFFSFLFPFSIWLLQMTFEARLGRRSLVLPTKHTESSLSNIYSSWLLYWKNKTLVTKTCGLDALGNSALACL